MICALQSYGLLNWFSEIDDALGFGEAPGEVGGDGGGVGGFGVGAEFGKAAGAGPVFDGRQEGGADALVPMGGIDPDAFEEGDGARFASVGEGADEDFGEADRVGGFGDEGGELGVGVKLGELLEVGFWGFGPEGVAHGGPGGEVGGRGGADDHRG